MKLLHACPHSFIKLTLFMSERAKSENSIESPVER
jgi:hypothetical protein